jgi:hypothetical protein
MRFADMTELQRDFAWCVTAGLLSGSAATWRGFLDGCAHMATLHAYPSGHDRVFRPQLTGSSVIDQSSAIARDACSRGG